MPEAVDVGQARQVAQRERLVGEQRAGEQRERSVLRAGNGKAAFQPFAATDENSVHVPLLKPNLPCASGPPVKRGRMCSTCCHSQARSQPPPYTPPRHVSRSAE